MSKTRNKTHNEVEHLKGQIRTLKSQNRQLRKRLKELDRKAHFFEDVVDEVVKDAKVSKSCKECGKGEILSYDLGIVRLDKCSICDYEKKVKKSLNE